MKIALFSDIHANLPILEAVNFYKDKIVLQLKIMIVILQYNKVIMGVTKTNLFSQEQIVLAQIAKGFAHPARIAIIQHLLKTNTCINGDLVQELGLAQATISQHLRELKEVGIIQGNIEGTRVCYCINPVRWETIKNKFNRMFNEFPPPSPANCC